VVPCDDVSGDVGGAQGWIGCIGPFLSNPSAKFALDGMKMKDEGKKLEEG